MRFAIALATLAAISAPGLAVAGSPAQCGQLTRQIEHYEDMAERARLADNQMWIDGMEQHVAVLKKHRKEGCDAFAEDDQAMAAFGQFLKLAAKGAVHYFTFGAY
jgi:hypothetical protein